MRQGQEQYGGVSVNWSLVAETLVGVGEKYESIQEALDAGYSCLYLKKQRFNVTEPIVPPKEDFYIVASGAEIVAAKPMSAVFDMRGVRYAHMEGLFINGNGLARKCVDAFRGPGQVPCHQIRNCKIWGATFANVDFTGCEDSLLFNCWIDGRKVNDVADAITEYGVKIGEFGDDYRTGGQIDMIHCLMGFHRIADVFVRNIAALKLANCLLSSKSQWSSELEANIIVEGGTGEDAIKPVLELMGCWAETSPDCPAPNILVKDYAISKLTVTGGTFLADRSPNIYSLLNPCAETITLVGTLFWNNPEYAGYNIVVATGKLVSVGCTYNGQGIDKTNVAAYLIFDRDTGKIETGTDPFP